MKYYFLPVLFLFLIGLFIYPVNVYGCGLTDTLSGYGSSACPDMGGCFSSGGGWYYNLLCFADGGYTQQIYGPDCSGCDSGGGGTGGGGGSDRVIGGVVKNGIRVNNVDYSITSADGATAGWETDQNGNRMYSIGRWNPSTQVAITLNNPDYGYGCTWDFWHPDDSGTVAVEIASGQGCTANITIYGGVYSPDWENDLFFTLVSCPAAGTIPACRTTGGSVPDGNCGTTTYTANCMTSCTGSTCNLPTPPTVSPLTCSSTPTYSVNINWTQSNHIHWADISDVGNNSSYSHKDVSGVTTGTTTAPTGFGVFVSPGVSTFNVGTTYYARVSNDSTTNKISNWTAFSRAGCPIAGGWSDSGDTGSGGWSPCPVVCGGGTQTKYCNNPTPQYGGAECVWEDTSDNPGQLTTPSNRIETKRCGAANCPAFLQTNGGDVHANQQ